MRSTDTQKYIPGSGKLYTSSDSLTYSLNLKPKFPVVEFHVNMLPHGTCQHRAGLYYYLPHSYHPSTVTHYKEIVDNIWRVASHMKKQENDWN